MPEKPQAFVVVTGRANGTSRCGEGAAEGLTKLRCILKHEDVQRVQVAPVTGVLIFFEQSAGQDDRESTAPSKSAFKFNRPAVGIDNPFCNRQADAGPVVMARQRAVNLEKPIENTFVVRCIDPDTTIAHDECQRIVFSFSGSDPNGAFMLRELRRVRQ